MNPEAQRIAIAEVCGFKNPKPCPHASDWPAPGPYGHWFDDENREVPSYLDDLNAMHDAEATLRGKILPDMDGHPSLDAWIYYGHFLACASENNPGDRAWHATAAQRAEAFLKTIGKWEDT